MLCVIHRQYYKEKTKILNNYTNKFIEVAINRINQIKANAVELPDFTINDSIDKVSTIYINKKVLYENTIQKYFKVQ